VVEAELSDGDPVVPSSHRRRFAGAVVALGLAATMLIGLWPQASGPVPTASAADTSLVRILAGTPQSLDPAHHGDQGSASYISQLYETLTAVDPTLAIRPALAESWVAEDGGKRVSFTLRPNLTFSDGSPLTADDVVHSWRRLFAAGNPSPLASLIADVVGARALLSGQSKDIESLGVRAEGDRTVVVDMVRGGGDLPAIVSGAPFAVVPRSATDAEITPTPGSFVGSGAYVLSAVNKDSFELTANPRYWAGKPAIETVRMVTSLAGRSQIDAFAANELDIAPVSYVDAGWIAYDRALGPSLRTDPELSVSYYGFDTKRAPFNDVRVRQAFAKAVDWRRLATLDEPGSSVPATGMVPPGMPGAPAGDFMPAYDPAGARQLLADAGYPGGKGLPPVSFAVPQSDTMRYDEAIVTMLRENLGVTIDYSTMDYATYQQRLATDPPQIWTLGWVADYPGPNDFLGVLLETGSTANQGGWSNAGFDAAIATATGASSPADATAAYATALGIVKDQVPMVPVSSGTSFSLVRDGLLGASQPGTGILRLAGLAWGNVP
jgi:oligopeptide transport system substrate-binding protein